MRHRDLVRFYILLYHFLINYFFLNILHVCFIVDYILEVENKLIRICGDVINSRKKTKQLETGTKFVVSKNSIFFSHFYVYFKSTSRRIVILIGCRNDNNDAGTSQDKGMKGEKKPLPNIYRRENSNKTSEDIFLRVAIANNFFQKFRIESTRRRDVT